MTVSVSSGGHDSGPAREWADKLAAALPEHQAWCHGEAHGDCCAGECDCGVADSLARLLPTVAGIVAGQLRAAAAMLTEYTAHAAREAREWEPDAARVTEWEAKASGYYWSARLLQDLADEIDPT